MSTPRHLRRDCFFGLHFDLHPGKSDTSLGADIDEDRLRYLLDCVQPDYVQYDCKGHAGYTGYPTEVGWPSPGIVKDSLALWRTVTREKGIGLYIHYSGVWDSVAIEHHPEWACVDAEANSSDKFTSTFGAYVDELMIPQLKEVAAAYDLDGIWVDGDCWAVRWDYSPAALEAWQNISGETDAPKPDEPKWQQWRQFQRDQFEHYLHRWIDALHQWNPHLQVTSNWMYTLHAPKAVAVNVDFISGDYAPFLSVDQARMDARYVANVGMPWDLMAWGFNNPPGQNWTLKTATHLQQEAAVVLMQGGGFQIYYQPTRSGYINETIIQTASEVASFCRQRQAVCHKSTSVPQVALLQSAASHWQESEKAFRPWGTTELQGALQVLVENHYSVDILTEELLQPRLQEFPLVVISNAIKMPEDFRIALIEYVDQGGALLLTDKSCRHFETELGVQFKGEAQEIAAVVQTSAGSVSLKGTWQEVLLEEAEAFAYRYPTWDTRGEGDIAATVRTLGNGRIGAIYGSAASAFYHSHHPYLRHLIGDLAKVLFRHPALTVQGPPTVDVALRKTAQGQLSIHLFNNTNTPHSQSYSHIDYIPEIGPIGLTLKTAQRPQQVWLEPEHQRLEWDWKADELKITVDKLHIHSVVVVED